MAGVNKVILIGNLGKDPEVRFTQDGKAIANITVATSESWKDKNSGQRQEKTEWHRVVFFGGVAQVVADYLKKGSKVYIEGKLQTRKWQNQQGQDQYTTEIVVDGFSGTMQMLDSRTGGDTSFNQDQPYQNSAPQKQAPQQNYQANQSSSAPQHQAAPAGHPFEDEFDDDIPF